MKKKLIKSLVFLTVLLVGIILYYNTNCDNNKNSILKLSSACYFGEGESDYERWIIYGDSENELVDYSINCNIEKGALVIKIYETKGYGYRETDKFELLKEEYINKSGEYFFDFNGLPEDGIYAVCVTPQNKEDNIFFEYVVTYMEKK